MNRIDEKTSVPLGWVLGGVVTLSLPAFLCAFWVFTVDARLTRIEEKLGITGPVSAGIVNEAQAAQKRE